KPTLICCKTVIGYGSPNKAGTHGVHGAPLGDAEIAATRKELGWTHAPFEVPSEIYAGWDAKEAGAARQATWEKAFAAYKSAHPELAAEYERRVIREDLPEDFVAKAEAYINECQQKQEKIATRKASQNAIEAYAKLLPEMLGGSADLGG